MNVFGQGFGHLASANICDGVQRKAVADLAVLMQIFPNRVHDQAQEVRVLMHKQSDSEVTLGGSINMGCSEESIRDERTICFSVYFELEMRLTASM
jgi:hypothetical protein